MPAKRHHAKKTSLGDRIFHYLVAILSNAVPSSLAIAIKCVQTDKVERSKPTEPDTQGMIVESASMSFELADSSFLNML